MNDYEHEGRRIEVEVRADATPHEAWAAWADPEKLSGWFVDRAMGEGRTGEVMTWIFESFGVEMAYKVLHSVPGERIVFGPADESVPPFLLEVTMTRSEGETVIRLVNSGFSDDADFDAQFEGMDSGWRMALGILREYLERYFARPKRTLLALHPTEADLDTILPWFTDREKLSAWLGELRAGGPDAGDGSDAGNGSDVANRAIGGVGSTVRLKMRDVKAEDGVLAALPAPHLDGRVLARTRREIALSWPQIRGTLELKCFAQGPGRVLCLRGLGWEMEEADARAVQQWMERAVSRLEVARRTAPSPAGGRSRV